MDSQWRALMRLILDVGTPRSDRTGIGTRAMFGARVVLDLRDGFPAVTTKKLYFGQVRAELAAFLAGAESLEEFHRHGCEIWDANIKAWKAGGGERAGRVYGVQWRRWRSPLIDGRPISMGISYRETDQVRRLVEGLIADPHGRRHLLQTWNPGELDMMCLPPCHVLSQFFAEDEDAPEDFKEKWLDSHFHMRSLDVFLGMPFDVASHALMLHLVARACGRRPRRLIMTSGDTHVYLNHFQQAETVMARQPLRPPRLVLVDEADLFGFDSGHAYLAEYEHHAAVFAPMNV